MTRILAIVDPEKDTQTALQRCAELPDSSDISIHIAFFVPIVSAEKMANHDYANPKQKMEKLEELVNEYKLNDKNVTLEVVPFDRLYEAIILTASNCSADYIFKPLRKHNLVRRSLITSTDWNLIRMCPIPVLLVSQIDSILGKPVLAAVDIGTRDESHDELNRIVLSHTKVVSQVVESTAHAVNACSYPSSAWGYSMGDPIPVDDSRNLMRKQMSENREELATIAKEFNIDADKAIVREGTPSQVINSYSQEVSAGIVILGTIARSGLAGLFIGNTAETVLENSINDILVVKQADFQSPIQDR